VRASFGARRARQAGFTLVEVLVAATLASIGLLGLTALHANALRTTAVGRNTNVATSLAAQGIEDLRRLPAASVASVSAQSITVAGRTYTRSATVSNAPVGTGKQVAVTVGWSDEFGAHSFQLVSVIGQ